MPNNPAVKLIVQPLRKLLEVADHVDSWRDEHKEDIASSTSELGLSTKQTVDHREFVVADATDVERSLDTFDPFGLTREIETVAERLDRVDEPHIADKFRAILAVVDEDKGDEHIPMDALKELLQQIYQVADTDEDWLPAELPSKCAKNLGMSLDTLKRRIKTKAIRVDVISQKSWRLHRVDAAKFGFSPQK